MCDQDTKEAQIKAEMSEKAIKKSRGMKKN
jgi:hypothetical protein